MGWVGFWGGGGGSRGGWLEVSFVRKNRGVTDRSGEQNINDVVCKYFLLVRTIVEQKVTTEYLFLGLVMAIFGLLSVW